MPEHGDNWLPPSQSKELAEIKKKPLNTNVLIKWLKSWHIFIKADSLGFKNIHVFGYFFFAHPNITHYTSLKGVIQEVLNDVCITQEEPLEIDPNAVEFYKPKELNNEDDEMLEDIPDKDE